MNYFFAFKYQQLALITAMQAKGTNRMVTFAFFGVTDNKEHN